MPVKKIGVFTSGGDSPGMNAAIRAVVRCAIYYEKEIYGIYRGYQGMIEGEIEAMNVRTVSNIIHRGGTILKSARSQEFMTSEGMQKAYEQLQIHGIDSLVAIGGDGTFRGAHEFYNLYGIPTIGIPGTIDNDIAGCDYTLGFDSAINTVVKAIDNIRDTANSHNRLFFIEVMGRDTGYIAVHSALAGGAEAYMIPEKAMSVEGLIEILEAGAQNKKSSSLVVVSEGNPSGGAYELAQKVKEKFSYYDTKVTVLGHIQRGGSPTVFDRILASQLGVAAVEALLEGLKELMVGRQGQRLVYTPLGETSSVEKGIETDLLRINKILSI